MVWLVTVHCTCCRPCGTVKSLFILGERFFKNQNKKNNPKTPIPYYFVSAKLFLLIKIKLIIMVVVGIL